jgi:hypothetical protein
MRLPSSLAAALVFAASGCTIMPLNSDAGTSGGTPTTETVGDQCAALASAFCTHIISDCGIAESLSDCITEESPTCCSVPSDCDAISQTSSSALASCESAIATQDCASATSSADGIADLGACQGIPTRP